MTILITCPNSLGPYTLSYDGIVPTYGYPHQKMNSLKKWVNSEKQA